MEGVSQRWIRLGGGSLPKGHVAKMIENLPNHLNSPIYICKYTYIIFLGQSLNVRYPYKGYLIFKRGPYKGILFKWSGPK